MADRFYTPDALTPGEYALAGEEARHLAGVMRAVPGDRVVLFNGDGLDYPATVVAGDRRAVVLAVGAGVPNNRERPRPLAVASALPKGDRADFLVEKLTELGVSRFIPLICERSVVRPKPDAVRKFARQVVEASKQCGRSVLMAVDPPASFAQLLAGEPVPGAVLHPYGAALLAAGGLPGLIAVGPEGGFSDAEVAMATAAGWGKFSLGERILRVETACLVVAAWPSTSAPGTPPARP